LKCAAKIVEYIFNCIAWQKREKFEFGKKYLLIVAFEKQY
jgi:hypothetical protein